MDNRPIGIFDSGLGGLTAVKQLQQIMPDESIIYLGDTGRVPYGSKSKETLKKYTKQNINFLLKQNVKVIVVACGTISSVALENICCTLPIIDVVKPSVDKAVALSTVNRIGVIGTKSTINSRSYEKFINKIDKNINVISKACPLFVPLVENGRFSEDDEVVKIIISEYLQGIKDNCIDTLILGCTHYPLLKKAIANFFDNGISLVNPGVEVAFYTQNILTQSDMKCSKNTDSYTKYFVTDDPGSFCTYAKIFLESDYDLEAEIVDITVF